MIMLSDQDILARLKTAEDSTVERKTANDYRDCLKTAVAFSNSLPVDDPGIIFVGVGTDGTVQDRLDLDTLQRNVSKEIDKIYPAISPQMKVLREAGGREFLAIIVRGSGSRPHFAGPSYIRDGSQTVAASDDQFARIIAERSSVVREILQWRLKGVTLSIKIKDAIPFYSFPVEVVDCNQFFVTVRRASGVASFPLRIVELNYDHKNERLELRILEERDPHGVFT